MISYLQMQGDSENNQLLGFREKYCLVFWKYFITDSLCITWGKKICKATITQEVKGYKCNYVIVNKKKSDVLTI